MKTRTSRSAERPPRRAPVALAIAAGSAGLVYAAATLSEILIIRALRPTEIELTWISNVILATAFGVGMFLWLHLKWTRLALSRLEREHLVLDTQLATAAEMQRSLLPAPPVPTHGVRWAARLEQAGKIGGDLYDFVQRTPGSCMVLVGDVSGKGIPAALAMASVRSMFRTVVRETDDPGEIIERVSRLLYVDNRGMPYVTCVVARLDLDTHELCYTNAGHPAGLVLNGHGEIPSQVLLESDGPPAGLFPDQTYVTRSLPLRRGATVILVTDGITGAFDALGMPGVPAVGEVVADLPPPVTADRICEALMQRTAPALATGTDGWQDDRTVVAFVLSG